MNEWLAHIERQHSQPIALGLDRVRLVKQALDQRQDCPVILVGGTNGKGSTCAMLETMLLRAGYRVGLYTSPHLLRYNERVRIDGRPVDDAALCEGFEKVEAGRKIAGDVPLTYFEYGTLAAWEAFAAQPLDAIILEVGLGGRLDATNVYEPDCAIVTTVDLDHMDYLGPTREDIGFEKAGIFRAGRPAICGDADPPRRLIDQATGIGADLKVLGRDFGYARQDGQWQYWGSSGKKSGLAYPALRGASQLSNASCALAALDALHDRLPVAMQDIRRGLLEVEVAGRFQVLPGRPAVVLDVAHNPQAARVLADNLGNMAFHPDNVKQQDRSLVISSAASQIEASPRGEDGRGGPIFSPRRSEGSLFHDPGWPIGAMSTTWAVFGMLRDKDIPGVVRAVRHRIDRWLPCTLEGPRAATAGELAAMLGNEGVAGPLPEFDSPAAAIAFAQENAGDNDRIVAFGSFLTVADVMRFLGRKA